jgi:hypothetical protein
MLSRATLMYAGLILTCVAAPAFAQDASRDRVELDAAAGRRIFQNVLLADRLAQHNHQPGRMRPRRIGRSSTQLLDARFSRVGFSRKRKAGSRADLGRV